MMMMIVIIMIISISIAIAITIINGRGRIISISAICHVSSSNNTGGDVTDGVIICVGVRLVVMLSFVLLVSVGNSIHSSRHTGITNGSKNNICAYTLVVQLLIYKLRITGINN